VPDLPAIVIPGALARLRRVRRSWPPLSETWVNERLTTLATDTEAFQAIARRPSFEQIQSFRSDDTSLWDTIRLMLTPRRSILANTNRYFLLQIAESEKPFRQRVPVPVPSDAWSQVTVARLTPGEREVVALRILLDLDAGSAARILGISQTNCTTRLNRALKKLEEALHVEELRERHHLPRLLVDHEHGADAAVGVAAAAPLRAGAMD